MNLCKNVEKLRKRPRKQKKLDFLRINVIIATTRENIVISKCNELILLSE